MKPNILFFFPDQLRFDWIPRDSNLPIHMPNLESLISSGVRFNQAVVSSPLCAPSRASLAAGVNYRRCGVPDSDSNYPLRQTTFYSLLRDAGYHVMGCGKFDLHKKTLDWGLDGKRMISEWGFTDGIDNAGKWDAVNSGAVTPKDPYMNFLHKRGLAQIHIQDFRNRKGYHSTKPTPLPEDAYCDNWIAQNGLNLLRNRPKNQPWFLMVNFAGPHSPMDITGQMEKLCRNRNFPQPVGGRRYAPEIHNAIRQNYAAMIENIDKWLGIYMSELEKEGDLQNTVIVFSSDHGEMLGDHGLWGKQVFFHPSICVPLVISGPGIKKNLKSNALVSLIDLAATFLDMAQLPIPPNMDSISLLSLLSGKVNSHRDYVQSDLGDWHAVWDGRHKLIWSEQPEGVDVPELLFDLENDPQETENVFPANSAISRKLRSLSS
jgi:arylsulfatase